MLYVQPQDLGPAERARYVLLGRLPVVGTVLGRQQPERLNPLGLGQRATNSSESQRALISGGEPSRHHFGPANDAERDPVADIEAVEFETRRSAMEIEATVAHRVAERDAVAVPVHALHRQKAVLALSSNFHAASQDSTRSLRRISLKTESIETNYKGE